MMRLALLSALSTCAFATALAAAPVTPDTTTWSSAPDPELESQSGSFSASGNSVTMGSNGYRAYVSDVVAMGDFTFSGTMRATADNDIMGIVLGYGDGNNNIRIGWEGGGDSDTEVPLPFANGLFMIEEIGGSASLLAESATNFWTRNVDYDFSLSVVGSTVNFTLTDGATTVGSFSETVTASTFGSFGVYIGSNYSTFTNLSYDFAPDSGTAPVPLPAGLPLLALGLGTLGVLRRRQKSA